MKRVIGLTGKKGSGKTTVAKFFEEFHDFKRVSFADALKKMIIKANLCTFDECYVEKTPFSRMIMQKIGTEIVREQIDPWFWEKKMIETIEKTEGDIVIDDVRFLTEAELIRGFGGEIFRVIRLTDKPDIDTHRSEMEQEKIETDGKIEAKEGDIECLRKWVSIFLK